MPGNEVGDRVHNFFADDSLSQDQPVFANDQWVGSQRQIGVPNFNPKNYDQKQPDIERGSSNSFFHVPSGLNFSHLMRSEFTRNQSQSQQSNLYGSQFYSQRRQDETNLLGMHTEPDQQNISLTGLSVYDSQQRSGSVHQPRAPASESPVSFDFFGSHQQMNNQQLGMLHSLPRQQSGYGDMQQLQQQIIFKKMQEMHRQQQCWQLDGGAGQENSMNQVSHFAKQASGGQSPALTNGTPVSDELNYSSPSEHTAGNPSNSNWWQRGSQAMLGSPNRGPVASSNYSQARMMGMVPQQMDQSLYGVPISSSRGSLNQYPNMASEKASVQQMPNLNSYNSGNQYAVLSDQASLQNGSLSSRQSFPGGNIYDHNSGQVLGSGVNVENHQQGNFLKRNESFQEFQGRHERADPSDTLQEDHTIECTAPPNSVALDPTEEKILFGSDDNIWDAFGGSGNLSGGSGNLYSAGSINGFPSIQSGSWSALMQSAVAETSSSDVRVQEEWSGLNLQNGDVQGRNQLTSTYDNNGKYPMSMDDSSRAVTTLVAGSAPLNDANMNHNNVMGFQHFGRKISDGLQASYSPSPAQQSSEGGGIWSNHGLPQKSLDDNQLHGKASHILDSDINEKNLSNPLTIRHAGLSQQGDKPIGWSVVECVQPGGGASSNIHDNENSQPSDRRNSIHGETAYGGLVWKNSSATNSALGQMHINSSGGILQSNKEGFSSGHAAVRPHSSGMRGNEEMTESLPGAQQLNYWKNVDSVMESKAIEGFPKPQKENSNESYHSNLSNSTSASGLRENVMSDANDLRNLPSGKRKSSNKVARKTTGRKFQYHPMGNVDEDVDSSYGMSQTTLSQDIPPQSFRGFNIRDFGYSGQPRAFSQSPNALSELEKRQSPSLQGQTKDNVEASSGGIYPDSVSNMLAPMNRSGGNQAISKSSQSRQNMQECMDNAHPSGESGRMASTNTFRLNSLSNVPEVENSDGDACPLQESSASRGMGLHLGPPSQVLPVSSRSLPMQNFVQTIDSLSSNNMLAATREKAHTKMGPTSGPSFLPTNVTFQEEKNGASLHGQTSTGTSLYKMPGSFSAGFTSGFPCSEIQFQFQPKAGTDGLGSINHLNNTTLVRHTSDSKQINDSTGNRSHTTGRSPYSNPTLFGDLSKPNNSNYPFERVSVLRSSVEEVVPNALSKSNAAQQSFLPNLVSCTSLSDKQHSPGGQTNGLTPPQSRQSNILESAPTSLQSPGIRENVVSELGAGTLSSQSFGHEGDQMMIRGHFLPASSGNINAMQKSTESEGKEHTVLHQSDATSAKAVLTQRDMEAFGRSLKPNNYLQQNYSLLNQMQVMKNPVRDSDNKDLKRLKGSDGSIASQQVAALAGKSSECNVDVGDAPIHHIVGPSGGSKMLNFPALVDNLEKDASQQASARVEQSQISPQMAPSWFSQFGTFRNGQMLPAYDARKTGVINPPEQTFALGNLSNSMHTLNSMDPLGAASIPSEPGKHHTSVTQSTIAVEQISSTKSLPPDFAPQNLLVSKPKKRKSITFEFHPWHKEVSLNSQNLWTISMIEVEWAKSTYRLPEKVEDDAEMVDDGFPNIRQKRRLILTTQLTQQLFFPVPRAIISADARSNYECVTYNIARRTLGDACNLACCSTRDSIVASDAANCVPDKWKTSERIDDSHMSKVVEDLLGKAKKLEDDLLRLDRRASFLDLKVEYQDLEKFSVINRFARFHGRGQVEGSGDASSSDATAIPHKSIPQRYVTALPLPRTLPDRVQCLSL